MSDMDPANCTTHEHQLALNIPPQRRCTHCGMTRPDQCGFDDESMYWLDILHGIPKPRFRPRGCIAIPDPATAEIPF